MKKLTCFIILFLLNTAVFISASDMMDNSTKIQVISMRSHEIIRFLEFVESVELLDFYRTDTQDISGLKSLKNAEDFEVLLDDELMYKFLRENEIYNVTDIRVLMVAHIDGYLLYIKTDNEVFFSPLLFNGDSYSGFVNREIYSPQEFDELSRPTDLKIIIYGREINYSLNGEMNYNEVYLPIRVIIESLGIEVNWNEENRSINFLNIELVTDGNTLDVYIDDLFVGESNYYYIKDGRVFVSEHLLESIKDALGIEVDIDKDQHVINIINKQTS